MCINEPYAVSHNWTVTLSAEHRCCRPPSSLVCRQLLNTCSIVCCLPHGHLSVVTRPHCSWQDVQWPQLVRKWSVNYQWHVSISNPGVQVAGSSTGEELTIEANFQSSCHHQTTSLAVRTLHYIGDYCTKSNTIKTVLWPCPDGYSAAVSALGSHTCLFPLQCTTDNS